LPKGPIARRENCKSGQGKKRERMWEPKHPECGDGLSGKERIMATEKKVGELASVGVLCGEPSGLILGPRTKEQT